MALTKVTGQVINDTTGLVVGVTTVGGGLSATDGFFSGIVTFSQGVSIGGTLTYEDVTNIDSVGLITARAGIVVGSGITLSVDGDGFFTGVVTATTFKGDGSQLSNVTSTTINNNADNRLITGSGTANTLEGESTLTYGGTELLISNASPSVKLNDTDNSGVVDINNVGGVAVVQSTGDTVFETNSSERLRIDSSGRIAFGGVSNNSSYDTNARNILLANESGNIGITIRSGGGDPYAMIHFADGTTDASEFRAGRIIYAHSNDSMSFSTANTERVKIDSSGHVLPSVNDTYDLGSSSLRWRDIYTGDLNLSNEGKTNDVDGTWGNYTIQEGENDLFLINNRSGKKYKFNLTEVS